MLCERVLYESYMSVRTDSQHTVFHLRSNAITRNNQLGTAISDGSDVFVPAVVDTW